MAELAGQIGLDFSARPAPKPESVPGEHTAKPKRPPRDRAVDEAVKIALACCLEGNHVGREKAATWEELRAEINGWGEGQDGALFITQVRRLQEAKEQLLDDGKPVVGISDSGVFWARTSEEVEVALRETERRAKRSLTHRRRLRRVYRELLGQEAMRAVEGATP